MARRTPIEKYEAAERLIDLCAEALRLRHPQGRSFVRLRPVVVMTWTDDRITNAIETMQAWIAEQPALPTGRE